MTYETLIQDACNSINGFKKAYEKAIKDDSIDNESGNHTVFSLVFVPLLMDAVNKKSPDAAQFFNFMEMMETCEDKNVAEVCEFTILEELCDNYEYGDLMDMLQNVEETRKALECIRRYVHD